MFIKFDFKQIYGILNPKLKLTGQSTFEIEQITIYINNHEYKYNDKEVKKDIDLFDIYIELPKNASHIKIVFNSKNKEIVVFDKKYGYLIRGLKVLSKPFRVIFNRLKLILRPIIKTIKLMWIRHHFIIPPRKLKRYIRSFLQNYIRPQENTFYNPEIQQEYNKWLKEEPEEEKTIEFKYNPLISIIVPVYNVEPKLLSECINSVLNQTYQNFELCICDDNSSNKETTNELKKYENNEKIKIKYRTENGMISKCMNSALELATGEYIGFLDNDDILDKNALYHMVEKLNKNKELALIYSDEDKLDEKGNYCDPHFKPDWSPDTFLSMNYICHFTIVKKSVLDKVGNFRSEYDGAQDYDLFLRITEETQNIGHVHKILYHWRKSSTSTAAASSNKNYAREAGKKALESALKRRKINGNVLLDEKSPFYIIEYEYKNEPKVSIVIPTKDHKDVLKKCISSIYEKTNYKNFEVVIVDNNTTEKSALDYIEKIKNKYNNVIVIEDKGEFNYSKINNDAIKKLKTDFVVLLNNDTEIITKDWLKIMVGYAMQKHIGCVGVKLLYPDQTVQHGGVVLGVGGVASHAFIGYERDSLGYFGRLRVPYNYSANTAACLMVSKNKFNQVGGLEEDLKVAYNDVDFNIKLLEAGYYNIFLPQVELFHHESKSRGYDTKGEKKIRFEKESQYMIDKWHRTIKNDKFYNFNLSNTVCFMLDKKK